jgi:hypothetical protein
MLGSHDLAMRHRNRIDRLEARLASLRLAERPAPRTDGFAIARRITEQPLEMLGIALGAGYLAVRLFALAARRERPRDSLALRRSTTAE